MAKGEPHPVDLRLAKAIEHPIRNEILSVLVRDGPSSPTQIQRRLANVSLNLVAHHMKVLKESGCIELAETVSTRGAREHIYRALAPFVLSDQDWGALPPEVRLPILMTLLRTISDELAGSLSAGKFERAADTYLSRSPLQLDQDGWSEVVELLVQTLERIGEIGVRSADRIALGDEDSIQATVVIMQFPTAESDEIASSREKCG